MSTTVLHKSYALADAPTFRFKGHDNPILIATVHFHVEDDGNTAVTLIDTEGGTYFLSDIVRDDPRYMVSEEDFDNYLAWALGYVSRQELVYLDDPTGDMVGFIQKDQWKPLVANLNRGLTPEQLDAEGVAWRTYDPDPGNYAVLINRIGHDASLGYGDVGPAQIMMLHDNDQSEVIGFIFAERAVELQTLLNR